MPFSLHISTNPTVGNKFLGLYLDSKLACSRQIYHLCTKLAHARCTEQKVNQINNKEAATINYYGLFHSILTYGIVGLGNASANNLQRVFIIQKQAVRSIVGAKSDEHCKPILGIWVSVPIFFNKQ